MTVRVRGIYTTALTALLDDVVQASPAIQDRFEESFPVEPAAVSITTTQDRQGLCITGAPSRVADTVAQVQALSTDTFVWRDQLPRGSLFAGEVVETLGSGALLECGTVPSADATADESGRDELTGVPFAGEERGFLPYSKTSRHLDVGDRLRVQVDELRPPWSDGRHVLETTVRVHGDLASLVRGYSSSSGQPELAEILPAEPPEGWGVDWTCSADDAGLDALSACLDSLSEQATALDEALSGVDGAEETAPQCYWPGELTCWVWFGREARFELDGIRREATHTMPGHHRIKAGTQSASTAVDFVEGFYADVDSVGDESKRMKDEELPFGVVTDQFGPREGDSVTIGHGKPDGRLFDLGRGDVTERESTGQITVKRELSGGGTYDALGVEKEAGDVAITKFKEGRWWYPTVYRSEDGEKRGTYVNICTPVEIFPDTVRYIDLHVDVIKHADGTVERVDDDELDDAVEAGYISPDLASKARAVATAVSNAL